MKTTKTVEIEICDHCGVERTPGSTFQCLGCSREVCTGCINYFSVEVRFSEPHQPRENFPYRSTTVSYPTRHQFRGRFCDNCEAKMTEVLTAAGLSKNEIDTDGRIALDKLTVSEPIPLQ